VLSYHKTDALAVGIPKAIWFLFSDKQTILQNKGVGLLFSLFLKFYGPEWSFYASLKYYICKNVDLVASRMKMHTLTNFFTLYFFTANIVWNPRQRRYLIIKYANYINRSLEFSTFLQKLGAGKVAKKS